MGIIQRQSTKFTIINFAGVLIGAFSILFIYSLEDEAYGFSVFLISVGLLISPFSSLGGLSLINKFFPEFYSKKKQDVFLGFSLTVITLGFIIFSVLAFLFKEPLLRFLAYLNFKEDLMEANILWMYIMTFLILGVSFLTQVISNYKRIVVPTLIYSFGYKVFLPVIILILHLKNFGLPFVAKSLVYFHIGTILIFIYYLIRLNGHHVSFKLTSISRSDLKRYFNYMFYGVLNGIGHVMSFRIDSIMISLFLGFASNGIYNKVLFMANVIDIPFNGINQISQPIISKAWEENDLTEIQKIYQKSSDNLLIVSGLLFLLIYFSLDYLISLSNNPASFANGKLIFLFLGLGKLFNMMTSVNNSVISFSPNYRMNLYFLLLLAGSNLVLNYYLIGKFEIIGAAVATSFALFLYNFIKFFYILYKFKMNPFSLNTIKILILILATYSVLFLLDGIISNAIFSIILNCSVISIIFISCVFVFQLSRELIESAKGFLNKYVLKK